MSAVAQFPARLETAAWRGAVFGVLTSLPVWFALAWALHLFG